MCRPSGLSLILSVPCGSAAPSQRAEILAVLTRGTAVFPQREKGDWVKVRLKSGAEGWIHASLLEAARPGARPASPSLSTRTGS